MNNEEAKFILHAYRPNGADAADAGFAAALTHTRQDPTIAKWFAAQQAFDQAVSAKLGQATPPAGLRDAILTGAKFDAGRETSSRSGGLRWSRLPAWIGLAACIALVGAAGLALWPKSAQAKSLLLEFAINDMANSDHHGGHGEVTTEFRDRLSSADKILTSGLSIDFETLHRKGCRVVSFDGRPLLEVCFQRNGTWFHAYVARVSDFPHLSEMVSPTFRDAPDGSAAVAWVDGGHLIILASEAGREALQRLI